MRADILLPGFKITADPRVDRRLVIGLDVAGRMRLCSAEPRAMFARATVGIACAFVQVTRS